MQTFETFNNFLILLLQQDKQKPVFYLCLFFHT